MSKGDDQKILTHEPNERQRRDGGDRLASPLLGNGRYELCEFISKGGMGAVYRAMDKELGRWVALKCLYDTENANSRDLALQEARTLAALNHPNILRVYDVLTINEQIWIVSEWLEGVPLSQIKKPLPAAAALAIISQVFAALSAAHEAQVIHRDVKPANIMLGNDGRITLIDFGVAFAPGNSTGSTIVGSLRYTDPRTLEGQHPDAYSDLFSTALVLAELLIGEPVLPDLAPLPLYRHIKRNLGWRIETIVDGIYPPAATLVRKYADASRVDELYYASPAREGALLSQDYVRKLTNKAPEEYLAGGICSGQYADQETKALMLREANDAIASASLSPKQKATWIAFRDAEALPEEERSITKSNKVQKPTFMRKAIVAGKRTQQLARKKTNFLTMSLALGMISLIFVWMLNSYLAKKEDYQKSLAIGDLINPTVKDQTPDPQSESSAAGELDKSALIQSFEGPQQATPQTWNINLDQPGNLVINGKEFGVVQSKDVVLGYGVHVFEIHRSGKPTSQFSMALSPESPRTITVKQ